MRVPHWKLLAGIMAVAAVIGLGLLGQRAWMAAQVGAGYKAKMLCSGVFVSGRGPESVLSTDLAFLDVVEARVDRAARSVTADVPLGLASRTAVHRPGLGCILAAGTAPASLRRNAPEMPAISAPPGNRPWPEGSAVQAAATDRPALDEALDAAFAETDPGRPRRTRAVVVVHDGRIVAERYAEGFSARTPQRGWSMAKSVTNALVGIRVKSGALELKARGLMPRWRGTDDPRRSITLDQMLRMSSGLAFEETYGGPLSDPGRMLFAARSAAGYAADKPLTAEPDTVWHYSSGTTNIVQQILRRSFEGDHEAYLRFPHRALFGPLGMSSAVLEPDPSGTYVGSSFMYASARDWARFGLLYLRDGVWGGQRILPEGWVEYSTRPTPDAPLAQYGAHWWLNAGSSAAPEDRRWPDVPRDAYFASGFQGQRIVVIPSRRTVIVRLGLTADDEVLDMNATVAAILRALPD